MEYIFIHKSCNNVVVFIDCICNACFYFFINAEVVLMLKIPKFHLISWCACARVCKRTVFAELPETLCAENCMFRQNFCIKKSGKTLVFDELFLF